MSSSCFPLPLEAPPRAAENDTPDKWRDSLSLALSAIPSGHRNSAAMFWVKRGSLLTAIPNAGLYKPIVTLFRLPIHPFIKTFSEDLWSI